MTTVTDWIPSDDDAPPLDGTPPPPDDLDRRRARRRGDIGALGRTPPQDIDAERAVLGSILMSKAALADVSEIVTPGDFYRPAHETIYAAALALYARGEPVDVITVADALDHAQALQRSGGPAYLHDLMAGVVIPASAGYHARIVAERAVARRLVEAGTRITQIGWDAGDDIIAAVARAETEIGAVREMPTLAGPDAGPGDTWDAVDLDSIIEGILDGTLTGPKAGIITRRDGNALLYPGAVHSISGEPGSGKSWFGLIGAIQEMSEGRPVLVIDFEDRADTFVSRLLQLGLDPALLLAHLRYVRPEASLTDQSWTRLAAHASDCRLVIIDGITEAMTMHGLSLMDNSDAAKWLALIPNRLANLGCAVLQVDHVVKDAESRGRYSIGAQHKLAGITGTAFTALTVKSFGKGEKGHTRIIIQKDKHGDVGPVGVTIADFHLDATAYRPSGAAVAPILAWLDTPQESHDEDGNFRPTVLMGRVSEYLQRSPGGSLKAIRLGVRGKAASIDLAVETLIREGFIRTEEGPRGATFHYLLAPFDSKE